MKSAFYIKLYKSTHSQKLSIQNTHKSAEGYASNINYLCKNGKRFSNREHLYVNKNLAFPLTATTRPHKITVQTAIHLSNRQKHVTLNVLLMQQTLPDQLKLAPLQLCQK